MAKGRGTVNDKQRNIERTSENRDSSPLPRGGQTKQGYLIFRLIRKGCQNRLTHKIVTQNSTYPASSAISCSSISTWFCRRENKTNLTDAHCSLSQPLLLNLESRKEFNYTDLKVNARFVLNHQRALYELGNKEEKCSAWETPSFAIMLLKNET